MKITYEELMEEILKYEPSKINWTEEQEKAIIEARRLNIPYAKIAKVFSEKYGRKFSDTTITKKHKRLIKKPTS